MGRCPSRTHDPRGSAPPSPKKFILPFLLSHSAIKKEPSAVAERRDNGKFSTPGSKGFRIATINITNHLCAAPNV